MDRHLNYPSPRSVPDEEHQITSGKHNGALHLQVELQSLHNIELKRDQLFLALWIFGVGLIQEHDHVVKRGMQRLVEFGSEQQADDGQQHQVQILVD